MKKINTESTYNFDFNCQYDFVLFKKETFFCFNFNLFFYREKINFNVAKIR